MEKRIEFFLRVDIILATVIALLPPALSFLVEIQDNTLHAAFLQYQHLCGWVVTFLGIAFIGVHTFRHTNALPYEILNAGRLVRMVGVLLFLSVAYLTISMPFPYNTQETFVPFTQYVITAVAVSIAALQVLAAIKKNDSPRALLILLIMYHLYFTSGVLLMGLIERNQPASFLGLFDMLRHSILWILLAATVLAVITGMMALKKRHSVLDEIFMQMKALNGIKDKVKKKEDSIKQNPMTPELTDALKALSGVLNPPPKPGPEDRLKNSLSEALEKFAKELGKSNQPSQLEDRLKSLESAIAKIAAEAGPAEGGGKPAAEGAKAV